MCQRNFKLVELKFVLVCLELKVEWQIFINHILYRGPSSFFFQNISYTTYYLEILWLLVLIFEAFFVRFLGVIFGKALVEKL